MEVERRLSIRARLLWLTVGLVVPLVLVGFYNLWSAWRASRAQLDVAVARQAEFAATAFEQWLTAQRQTLVTIKDLAENNQSPLTLKDYLNSIVKTRPHWLDVQLVAAGGDVRLSQSAKDRPPPLISNDTLRDEVAAKGGLILLTEQFDEENLRLISLALPVGAGDFVAARIDGKSASRIFEQLELPPDHIVAVFDDRRRLLYRNRVSPEQMSLDVAGTPLLSALDRSDVAWIEIESPFDKVERVYGLARLKTADYIVAVGVPSANLYEAARRQFVYHLFFGAAALGLAVLAALFITNTIVAPMRVLNDAARAFGAGDLRTRTEIVESGVIRELGQTFNQMARQIAEREEKLKELDRLKSDFVSNVSHELRTPLTTIKTLVHVLQQGGVSAAERREFLETIAVECDRQIEFVQNLLDLSRIESGDYRIKPVDVDVDALLRGAVEAQKHAAAARGLEIEFQRPAAPLPNIVTDAGALRRIVASLLENAVKYTPAGGTVRLRAAARGDRVEIEIADTGCGIAADDLPRIFEKFYRGRPLGEANGAERPSADECDAVGETNGVGLGLYLVKNLADQIGARIGAASPAAGGERGTSFKLSVPLEDQKKFE